MSGESLPLSHWETIVLTYLAIAVLILVPLLSCYPSRTPRDFW